MTVRVVTDTPPARAPRDFERKAFYSPKEYAELAGIHPSTVLDLIHAGRLWAVRLSERVYRIPLAAVVSSLYPGEIREPQVERTGDLNRLLAGDERRAAGEGLRKRPRR
jgi:excisionase family DNA binding protein